MKRHLIEIIFLVMISVSGCRYETSVNPVLLLSNKADFGNYTSEILKTEGFNLYTSDSINNRNISASYLGKFDLIIMAESDADNARLSLLKNYVKNGGRLIVLNPDERLSELLGIERQSGSIPSGYMGIDTAKVQGKGLRSNLLQIHDGTGYYSLKGATSLASMHSSRISIEKYPAVVSKSFGKGQAIMFLYNFPRNIVLTRQGNPAFAGLEKDGIPGLRPMDLFTDGWVDTVNNSINQADVQMSLFSHCIENLTAGKIPLPRFWYFPDTLKCLVTLTNDGEFKGESDFEPQFRDVDSSGAKMSLYILGVDKVSKAWVNKWISKGFEIAGHPDDTKEAGNPEWQTMDNALRIRKNEIDSVYGLPMRTNVNHWFVWCGRNADGSPEFSAEAKLEDKNGIGMDINYAHYDMNSNQGDHYLGSPGLNQGNFTGSGLVMKFASSKGEIINIYQHLNSVYDQEYNEGHDPEGFFNCFKDLMDRSLNNEVYSFISVKSHNDEYYFSKKPLLKMLAYARQNKIPVWTEEKLLEFLRMKDEASFSGFNWSGNLLKFTLTSHIKYSTGLSFLLPAYHNKLKIKDISINGESLKIVQWRVKGYDYAVVTVSPGKTYNISVKYEQ